MSTTRHDKQDQVMSSQVITATAVSEDSKDMTAADIDLSVNREMGYEILPENDPGGTVDATSLTFEAIQADDAALTSNVEVIGSTGAITTASGKLDKGKIVSLGIRKGAMTKQYQGVRVTVTGGTSPTQTFSAFFGPVDEQASFKPVARPSGQAPSYTP